MQNRLKKKRKKLRVKIFDEDKTEIEGPSKIQSLAHLQSLNQNMGKTYPKIFPKWGQQNHRKTIQKGINSDPSISKYVLSAVSPTKSSELLARLYRSKIKLVSCLYDRSISASVRKQKNVPYRHNIQSPRSKVSGVYSIFADAIIPTQI